MQAYTSRDRLHSTASRTFKSYMATVSLLTLLSIFLVQQKERIVEVILPAHTVEAIQNKTIKVLVAMTGLNQTQASAGKAATPQKQVFTIDVPSDKPLQRFSSAIKPDPTPSEPVKEIDFGDVPVGTRQGIDPLGTGTDANSIGNRIGNSDTPGIGSNTNRIGVSDTATEEPFSYVDKEPEYDFNKLQANVMYPSFAIENRIEGQVLVKVTIGMDGNVAKVKILSSDSPILEQAAIQGIMKTAFKPGQLNGENIECVIIVPVKFTLR